MGGSIKPINPNLLKIMPKLFKKKTIQSNKTKNSKGGRVRMSGDISKTQMNEISSKLEALKAKYK